MVYFCISTFGHIAWFYIYLMCYKFLMSWVSGGLWLLKKIDFLYGMLVLKMKTYKRLANEVTSSWLSSLWNIGNCLGLLLVISCNKDLKELAGWGAMKNAYILTSRFCMLRAVQSVFGYSGAFLHSFAWLLCCKILNELSLVVSWNMHRPIYGWFDLGCLTRKGDGVSWRDIVVIVCWFISLKY